MKFVQRNPENETFPPNALTAWVGFNSYFVPEEGDLIEVRPPVDVDALLDAGMGPQYLLSELLWLRSTLPGNAGVGPTGRVAEREPAAARWLIGLLDDIEYVTEQGVMKGVAELHVMAARSGLARRVAMQALKDAELELAIDLYVAHHNIEPKPFIWTTRASDILAKVTRAKAALATAAK